MIRWNYEVTDTFGGEANYCWVDRGSVEIPSDSRRSLVRAMKRIAGWTGIPCRVSDFGDMVEIRPRGICQVAFLTWPD